MKKILITGIGGLTPRSIAGIIRENHPDYYLIGVDVNKKAVGFFMKGLLDEYQVLWSGETTSIRMASIPVLFLWEANRYRCR